MQNTDDIIEIDLKEIFVVLLNKLWLIMLCGIVTGVISFCYSSFLITPQYQSTTKVYILNNQNGDNVTYSDLQMGTILTKDYKELIKSRNVLETVIENCKLDEKYGSLAGRVLVEPISDTRIIAITVEDPDPETARYLADEVRKVAAKHIKQVMDIEAVNVVEEANLPENPASPSVVKWTVLGLALGMCACVGVILLKYLLDDTIKTSEDVEKYLGLSTLAMIPVMEDEVSASKKRKNSRQRTYNAVDLESEDNKPQHKVEVEDLKESDTEEGK
ncbi:MAG: protein-tyrosine kinase [Lachnospiraceae bacterium]|nr:protein-tyrosine kinase [Lachnospiraceae bacterium]